MVNTREGVGVGGGAETDIVNFCQCHKVAPGLHPASIIDLTSVRTNGQDHYANQNTYTNNRRKRRRYSMLLLIMIIAVNHYHVMKYNLAPTNSTVIWESC